MGGFKLGMNLGMILLLLLLQVLLHGAQAVNYVVGGETVKWSLPQSTGNNASFYTTWAGSKTFTVGDTLIFIYTAGAHDVLQVRYPSDFKACNTQNPISVNNSGYTVIPLTMTGSSYFMCGVPGHCVQGMNLEVVVMTSEESAPSPNSPGTANSPLPISQGGPTSPPTAITVEAPTAQQGNGAILQPPASTVTLFVGAAAAALLGWVVVSLF
ncbi:unnamed protein product [Sphagnum troendelagicum]|uniref:Phytocyanin domain-containing protein n=1 Tax=Sphagnum troendelagicum TaxID=128251 RepID=A0ABP0V4F1_9BRYO